MRSRCRSVRRIRIRIACLTGRVTRFHLNRFRHADDECGAFTLDHVERQAHVIPDLSIGETAPDGLLTRVLHRHTGHAHTGRDVAADDPLGHILFGDRRKVQDHAREDDRPREVFHDHVTLRPVGLDHRGVDLGIRERVIRGAHEGHGRGLGIVEIEPFRETVQSRDVGLKRHM